MVKNSNRSWVGYKHLIVITKKGLVSREMYSLPMYSVMSVNSPLHEQSRCGICTNLSQFTPVGYFIRFGTGGCNETCSLYQIEEQEEI